LFGSTCVFIYVITNYNMESFNTMTRKVGNSVGVLIPAASLERGGLELGQEVRVTIAPVIKESIRGRFKGLCTPEELDEFVKENKNAWGD